MKGYRSETLFGDGYTDPLEVAFFETRDLGNPDIPETLLKNDPWLTDDQKKYLKTYEQYEELDKEYFQEIVRKYIGDRNFCKWLCKSPEDIWKNYVHPLDKSVSLELFLATEEITEYEIPEDAIVLADLGSEGALYCWKK